MYEILRNVQLKFKAVKDQRNDFGGFNYRNVEVMLSELKPILAEYDSCITFSDEIIGHDGRFYVEATATLHCPDLRHLLVVGHSSETVFWHQDSFSGFCKTWVSLRDPL